MLKLNMKWLAVSLCATSLCCGAASAAQNNPFSGALQQGQFPPPEEVFVLDYQQVDSLLTVSFKIREGFYLYQHRFGFEPEQLIHTQRPMPEGIEYKHEFFGDTVICRERVEFQVDLNQAERNQVLNVRYQGCADQGFCYPPATQPIFLRRTAGAGEAIPATASPELSETNVAHD